jgi:predicted TIM-barrel enzyme
MNSCTSKQDLKWLRIHDQIVDAVPALVGDEVNTYAPKELQHLEIGVSFIVSSSVHEKNPIWNSMDVGENCSRLS